MFTADTSLLIAIITATLAIYFILRRSEKLNRWMKKTFGRGKQLSAMTLSQEQAEKLIDEALHQLNCQPEWRTDRDSRVVRYTYQSGHFSLRIDQQPSTLRLLFFYCFNTPFDNLALVRTLCNQSNINSENERLVYTMNEEKHEIDVHILSQMSISEPHPAEKLRLLMGEVFSWQNAFIRRFNELQSEEQANPTGDQEESTAEWKRELFLLRQQELTHQSVGEVRESPAKSLTIERYADLAFDIPGFLPTELTVMTGQIETITDKSAISSYVISSPLIADNRFARQNATLHLSYFDPKKPEEKRQMVISLNAEKEDGQSLYYRITAVIVPLSFDKEVSVWSMRNSTDSQSILAAYDRTTEKQRLDEFQYMWKEALEKQKNGEEGTLTPEQQLISNCLDSHLAQNLYRGKRLFLNKRYCEALLYLEDAFQEMQPHYNDMKQAMKDRFLDVCYYIGFCYLEMEQYSRAYYYLDILSGTNRVTFTQELVNCLTNAGDVRALSYINGLLDQLRESHEEDDEEEEIPDHIVGFSNFLKRRKAYVLIDMGKLDEAKQMLNQMLHEPDNSDFAISELAYIRKLEIKDTSQTDEKT